jgi:hypothetical protein
MSGAMPSPVSTTVIVALVPTRPDEIVTRPPRGVNLIVAIVTCSETGA